MKPPSGIKRHVKRNNKLISLYGPHKAMWKDLAEYCMPFRGNFAGDEDLTTRRNTKNLNNTALLAVRIMASGMRAGMTDPSRPWFRLMPSDPDMRKYEPVKKYLWTVEQAMFDIFNKTGLYRNLHAVYTELAVFGTSVMMQFDSFDNVTRFNTLTAGDYRIAVDHEGKVNTLYRDADLTVEQAVGFYGLDRVSATVRRMYDNGDYDENVKIIHAVEPNRNRNKQSKLSKNKAFSSVHFEAESNDSKYLRQSGFDRFPAYGPRWEVVGTKDVYGVAPSFYALGDAAALQGKELEKDKGLIKSLNPPLKASGGLKKARISGIPGKVSYLSDGAGKDILEPIYQVSPEMAGIINDIMRTEDRVREAFYVNLFMMMLSSDRRQITATEVVERHEEKLTMLGPVLTQFRDDLLEPLIDNTFVRMLAAGILPPPPPELAGQELELDLISVLAMAQKQVEIETIEDTLQFAGTVAQLNPSILDRINVDGAIDRFGELRNVPPGIITPMEEAQAQRDAKAQAEQMQALQAQAGQAIEGAKMLSETSAGGGNLLDAALGGMKI